MIEEISRQDGSAGWNVMTWTGTGLFADYLAEADMSFPRTNVNGVILPDGTVLFCSGIDGYKWGPNSPTLTAELFDPVTETWTSMASMSVVRQYHSVSVLLPDGRVLNSFRPRRPLSVRSPFIA